MPNIFDPQWDAEQERPPFSWRRARLGRQAGSEKLGASVFELAPGCSTFPLHVHHSNEELIYPSYCEHYRLASHILPVQ